MKVLQILVLVFGLSVFANAQESSLTGAVYDAQGSVITKAKVIATNEKGENFETVTNEDGIYVLKLPFNVYYANDNFKIAKYSILVEANGFGRFTYNNFKFVPSYTGKMSLDVALEVEPIID
jgi:hypothetical protein